MEALAQAIRAGNRLALSRSLTLTESTKREHQALAQELLNILTHTQYPAESRQPPQKGPALPEAAAATVTGASSYRGQAYSIGISGPPGAGKSTLIDSLGYSMVQSGNKVAVLAVDPSSDISGGAILGDKTRMAKLTSAMDAYVRPSPSRGTLGGVARSTSEAMVLCTAAGYDRVLVETVGVGQSEIAVADLVDCMLLVMPPIGGDELQSIKRGITEVADVVVVNKADGPTKLAASRAAASFRATMHLHRPRKKSWSPKVLAVSAHTGAGLEELQHVVGEYYETMKSSGELNELRERQRARVAWTAAEELLLERLRASQDVKREYSRLLPDITSWRLGPRSAAGHLIDCFQKNVS